MKLCQGVATYVRGVQLSMSAELYMHAVGACGTCTPLKCRTEVRSGLSCLRRGQQVLHRGHSQLVAVLFTYFRCQPNYKVCVICQLITVVVGCLHFLSVAYRLVNLRVHVYLATNSRTLTSTCRIVPSLRSIRDDLELSLFCWLIA